MKKEKNQYYKTKEPKYFYDLLEKYKNLRNNLTKTVKEVYFSENVVFFKPKNSFYII